MEIRPLFIVILFSALAFAEMPSVPVQNVAPPIAAAAVAKPVPVVAPEPTIAVKASAAPPEWAQELITTAEKLPLVGPVVSKLLVYLGILSSILTVAVGAILAILNSLMGVFNAAGLTAAAAAVVKFRDGKIMYWLKFLSLFNAKKSPSDPPMPPPSV